MSEEVRMILGGLALLAGYGLGKLAAGAIYDWWEERWYRRRSK